MSWAFSPGFEVRRKISGHCEARPVRAVYHSQMAAPLIMVMLYGLSHCKGKLTNELPLQGAGFVVGIISRGVATGL